VPSDETGSPGHQNPGSPQIRCNARHDTISLASLRARRA
jgi:hypothetical protein